MEEKFTKKHFDQLKDIVNLMLQIHQLEKYYLN